MEKFDVTDAELVAYSMATYKISHHSNEKAFDAIPLDTQDKIKKYYQYLRQNHGILPNKVVDGKMTYYEMVSYEEAWGNAKMDRFHKEDDLPF